MMTYAAEGKGAVMFISSKKNGEIGPTMFLDAENDQIIFSTKSGAQLVIDGNKMQVEATKIIVQEKIRQKSKEAIEAQERAIMLWMQKNGFVKGV